VQAHDHAARQMPAVQLLGTRCEHIGDDDLEVMLVEPLCETTRIQ
jgi:hypothetical protein